MADSLMTIANRLNPQPGNSDGSRTPDPYAAIRTLNIQQQQAGGPTWVERGDSGGDWEEQAPTYTADFEALRGAGFQSKHNAIQDLGDGRVSVTFQEPGQHKNRTLEAIYAKGPDGQWVLQGTPTPTQQTGSDPRNIVSKGLQDLGLKEEIATGLTQGPTAANALVVREGARLVERTPGGNSGAVGRLNREVIRNADKDIRTEERGAARAAIIAGSVYGSGYLGAGTEAAAPAAAEGGTATLGGLPEVAQAGSSGAALAPTGTASAATTSSIPSVAGGSTMGMTAGDWINLGGLVNSVVNRPKPPDTSGINDSARASAEIAGRQQDLAEKVYADQKALQDKYFPLLEQQMQLSLKEQGKSIERGDAAWDDYNSIWRPAEKQLAEKSLSWASEPRMRAEAERAGAETAAQFDLARNETRRSLATAGASPDKIAALEAAGRLEEAKAVGGAQGNARRTVENQAMAYLDNAARFGRGLPSQGLAVAGLASQQGGQVAGGYGNLVSATSAPAAAANPIYSSAVGSYGQSGSLFGDASQMAYRGSLDRYNALMGAIQGSANYAGQRGWLGGP